MIKNLAHILYHVAVVVLSAAAALSLPAAVRFVARNYLGYWTLIENEKVFLVGIELAVAVFLILLVNTAVRSLRDRRFSGMARSIGLHSVSRARGVFSGMRIRGLRERQSFGRDLMILGSTGSRTFVDPAGDLHAALKHCHAAKIMLLDPYREGARARSLSLAEPGITPESFREQILRSIEHLRQLKSAQKSVQLKLYPEVPLFKIAIFGDYLSLQHYHPGQDIRKLPEMLFERDQKIGSLYLPLSEYFLARWLDPSLPEYDFETDELVRRDKTGNVVDRERFGRLEAEAAAVAAAAG